MNTELETESREQMNDTENYGLYIEKWTQIGLSTEPIDKELVLESVPKLYKAGGLKPPKCGVVFFGSPYSMLLARAAIEYPAKAGNLRAFAEKVGESVALSADTGLAVLNQRIGEYRSEPWTPEEIAKVMASIPDYVGQCIEGQGEIWLSSYDYLRNEEGDNVDELNGLFGMAESSNWALPMEDAIFVSDRPCKIALDEQNRLHCADGPAIEYRDGYAQYYWHGVSVPKRVVMDPESYTSEEIRNARNTEKVRALAERMGWEKFLQAVGAKLVSDWHDEKTGLDYELYSVPEIAGQVSPKLLRKRSPALNDGQQPWYVEPVDSRLETAQAARKLQFLAGFLPTNADRREFNKLVEHCNDAPELDYVEET